jgi:rhodanese-related sulfurtransferase
MDINQLIEFSSNHPFLVVALFALLAILAAGEIRLRLSGVTDIEPGAATRMLNAQNAILVDMRADKDYQAGHIVNALHLTAQDNLSALEKFRDRPVIVYCNSGQRSIAFCSKLRKQNFESVYNLKGGILAWQKAELPLTRKDSA